ncbi:MAG: HDOD domain-containing protein [bacterium]|nr:HDOD domain-containing protein [bacterium]
MNQSPELFNRIDDAPPLSEAAAGLIEVLCDDDMEAGEAASLLAGHPELADSMFHLARAIHADDPRVESESILNLMNQFSPSVCLEWAAAGAMRDWLAQPLRGFGMAKNDLLVHSLATGLGVEYVARECGLPRPPLAFLSGFTHDVGLWIGEFVMHLDFTPVFDLIHKQGIAVDEAERFVWGFDHSQTGARALSRWGFPVAVCEAARAHHQPGLAPENLKTLADLVHVADALSRMAGIGSGREGLSFHTSSDSEKRLGFTTHHAEMAVFRMHDGLEKLSGWLNANA